MPDAHPLSKSAIYTSAVVILAIVVVAAMVTLAIAKPNDTSTGTIIIGTLGPIIAAFLAAALKDLHGAVNSRLTELLEVTARQSHAEGRLEESSRNIPLPIVRRDAP